MPVNRRPTWSEQMVASQAAQAEQNRISAMPEGAAKYAAAIQYSQAHPGRINGHSAGDITVAGGKTTQNPTGMNTILGEYQSNAQRAMGANSPEWKAAVDAYNAGTLPKDSPFQAMFTALNNYEPQVMKPGNVQYGVGPGAEKQWAQDSIPGGWDKVGAAIPGIAGAAIGNIIGGPVVGGGMGGLFNTLANNPDPTFGDALKGTAKGAAMGYVGGELGKAVSGGLGTTGTVAADGSVVASDGTILAPAGSATSTAGSAAVVNASGNIVPAAEVSGLQGAATGAAKAAIGGGNLGQIATGAATGGATGAVGGESRDAGLGSVATGVLTGLTGSAIGNLTKPSTTNTGASNMTTTTTDPSWTGVLQATAGPLIGAALGSDSSAGAKTAATMADPYGANRAQWDPQLQSLMAQGPQNQQPFSFSTTGPNADPSYRFRLDQGADNLNRGLAATGQTGSGAQLAQLDQYGQGMASQEFGNQFKRWQEQHNMGQADFINRYKQLAQLSGADYSGQSQSSDIMAKLAAAQNAGLGQIGNTLASAVPWGSVASGVSSMFSGTGGTTDPAALSAAVNPTINQTPTIYDTGTMSSTVDPNSLANGWGNATTYSPMPATDPTLGYVNTSMAGY